MLPYALKEWSVAIDALIQGETILLLRKGGIREEGKHFAVPHQQVWLYPTYEHQKPHLLKPQWADQVTTVAPGWHPNQVTLQAWAEIVHVWTVKSLATVNALQPFHIWNQQFVTERFRWKPSQPLHLLLLRVHRLETPITIDWQPAHGGCRSWFKLDLPMHLSKQELTSTPVLSQQQWTTLKQAIRHQIDAIDPDLVKSAAPWQGNEII
ncbi:DUF1802 family protein [Leptothoe sp. PORK10 BA2]|uniref:DUF1802 family protein n=1 Tax=Leptothoe sp. PORK10 BA2 TaxID=3110254 RepID=UPI002B1FEE8C|nr:DUF1802 family protein [Leptothoe sp. PORK10 BA2]MEA5465126.1 DUF1802 family protein [Leptothoe sp. PORK10 BA2]